MASSLQLNGVGTRPGQDDAHASNTQTRRRLCFEEGKDAGENTFEPSDGSELNKVRQVAALVFAGRAGSAADNDIEPILDNSVQESTEKTTTVFSLCSDVKHEECDAQAAVDHWKWSANYHWQDAVIEGHYY